MVLVDDSSASAKYEGATHAISQIPSGRGRHRHDLGRIHRRQKRAEIRADSALMHLLLATTMDNDGVGLREVTRRERVRADESAKLLKVVGVPAGDDRVDRRRGLRGRRRDGDTGAIAPAVTPAFDARRSADDVVRAALVALHDAGSLDVSHPGGSAASTSWCARRLRTARGTCPRACTLRPG